jgi:glycosyltransferase involved in cell wall biosynthesis
MKLSVIICTYNPRPDYLQRVLDALKAQTLPKDQWELLLIDNASKEPLKKGWDLSWHSHARIVREDELGVMAARLRGIKESSGELLVLVDDDNVLADDYLEQALRLGNEWPQLGVFGGQIFPVFEIPPPEWLKNYFHLLACREFTADRWSNIPTENESLPCGAGMCVRRSVALKYADEVENSPGRIRFGRQGNVLNGCEDTDMAFVACDMGLGMGEMRALKLTHLIPERRMNVDYLVRLWEGMIYSSRLLLATRGHMPYVRGFFGRSYDWLKCWRYPRLERRFLLAKMRGERRAVKEIIRLKILKQR